MYSSEFIQKKHLHILLEYFNTIHLSDQKYYSKPIANISNPTITI